ncbi:plasmid partition protein ParG [Anabaena azotica]|nr:plasmid partition protein ParG [Anabaena azotica]
MGGDARIRDIAQVETMPKKIPEGMTELSVYIEKQVKTDFKVACTKQNKSMGEVVNQLLKEWLKVNE